MPVTDVVYGCVLLERIGKSMPATIVSNAFSWATFTASVSAEPSATLMIRRSLPTAPTETVPLFASAATLVKKEAPLCTVATEF